MSRSTKPKRPTRSLTPVRAPLPPQAKRALTKPVPRKAPANTRGGGFRG